MKIAFFEVKPDEKVFFTEALKGHELSFFETTINDALQQSQEYEIISVFVHSYINETVLDLLPNLRYIQTRSTGYDHITCKEIYARGLTLSNVAGYAGPAVGEFAFSLLLNAIRHTHTAISRSKEDNFVYEDLQGTELYAKTVGILGLGTIGERIAYIASGFGMNIMAWSRTRKPIVDKLQIDFTDIDDLLARSDVIMIALPLNPTTKDLINSENIHLLKPTAIIINIARAEIIEATLYASIPNPLGLDFSISTKATRNKQILHTPHMAYYTKEALIRIMNISLENMLVFIEKQTLPNCLKLVCHQDYEQKKDA